MNGKFVFLFVTLTVLASARTIPVEAQSVEVTKPYRHFKIRNPAQLSPAEAISVYDKMASSMARGYGMSRDPAALQYGRWRRYNLSPYNSVTHGNRYVNNFANALAGRYGQMKVGDKMPAGAIVVKDSFTVTSDRSVFAGALFVMEKLPAGTSPATGDWRYRMIMPDGSLFGDSRGIGAGEVAFCHDCHKANADRDYLFFMPEKYRRQFPD